MIDVTLKINGQTVSPNQFGTELERAILKELIQNIQKELRSVTCPKHGQRPKVTVNGRTLGKLSFEVEGCCQSLIDSALKRLK